VTFLITVALSFVVAYLVISLVKGEE